LRGNLVNISALKTLLTVLLVLLGSGSISLTPELENVPFRPADPFLFLKSADSHNHHALTATQESKKTTPAYSLDMGTSSTVPISVQVEALLSSYDITANKMGESASTVPTKVSATKRDAATRVQLRHVQKTTSDPFSIPSSELPVNERGSEFGTPGDEQIFGAPDDPDIPIGVLTSMVEDDPWGDTLSLEDENPFFHPLQELIEDQSALNDSQDASPTDQTDENSGDSGNDNQDQPPNDSGGEDQTNDGQDNSGGASGDTSDGDSEDVQEPDPEKIEVILFSGQQKKDRNKRNKTKSGNVYSVVTSVAVQLDETHFELDTGKIIEIDFDWIHCNANYGEFFFFDDFNRDGATDFLRCTKKRSKCTLYVNTGSDWVAMQPFTLPYQPTGVVRMSFSSTKKKQLTFYSSQAGVIDFLEDLGNFQSLFTLNFPPEYDGLAASDFNHDGLDDLVLLNFNDNTVSYLLNVNGQSLRPLSYNLPVFSEPRQISFCPTSEAVCVDIWHCQYEPTNLIYIKKSKKKKISALSFSTLSPQTYLLLGDFDKDGVVDIGFGHMIN